MLLDMGALVLSRYRLEAWVLGLLYAAQRLYYPSAIDTISCLTRHALTHPIDNSVANTY
jgi:hypothetical protein